MANCNPKGWRDVTPNVTPKMADFLGCNPVTPIPRREKERGRVTDRVQLVLITIIHYTYVYKGNREYRAENRFLSYSFSGIGVTRLQPAETLGFWGYISGYKRGFGGVTRLAGGFGWASGLARLRF
jgi:hypothetical protein